MLSQGYSYMFDRLYNVIKHRHAVRAERMTFLTREFGVRSERVVDGVDGL